MDASCFSDLLWQNALWPSDHEAGTTGTSDTEVSDITREYLIRLNRPVAEANQSFVQLELTCDVCGEMMWTKGRIVAPPSGSVFSERVRPDKDWPKRFSDPTTAYKLINLIYSWLEIGWTSEYQWKYFWSWTDSEDVTL